MVADHRRALALAGLVIAVSVGVVVFLGSRFGPSSYSYHPTSKRVQDSLQDPKTKAYLEDIVPKDVALTNEEKEKLPPKFDIKQYLLEVSLPKARKNITLYTFKTDFSEDDVKALAGKTLGGTYAIAEDPQQPVLTASTDRGVLSFNMLTGGFSLYSVSTEFPNTLPDDNDKKIPLLTKYLKEDLGVIDDTITPTAFYVRNGDDSTVFFEYHRQNVDLPIINPFAIVALSDDKKIEDLAYNRYGKDDPKDETITYASDRSGVARRNDFNTLTAALTYNEKSGKWLITSIESNLRPIESVSSTQEKQLTILPPSQIASQLKDGTYFNMSLPSGTGGIDLEKVYPGKALRSNDATITDVSLGYFEKPGVVQQAYLQPGYIVRGYTETETGIRVAFSQVVPAIDSPAIYAHNSPSVLSRLLSYVLDLITPSSYAQTNDTTGAEFVCHDGKLPYWCIFEKFKLTPTPRAPTTPTPTALPTPTQVPAVGPTATPYPTPTNTEITPCALFDKEGNVVEYAYEFNTPELTLYSSNNGRTWDQTIYSVSVAYFKSLPNGPLFYRYNNAAQPTLMPNRNIPLNTQYRQFQKVLDVELSIRGAKVLQANPDLRDNILIRLGRYGSVTEIVDVNALFPDVEIDMEQNWFAIQGTFSGYLKYAIQEESGWTIDSLASQEQPLPDIPLRVLLYSRLAFSGSPIRDLIVEGLQDYLFDARCAFLSPISPSLYFYPEQDESVSMKFDHDKTVYADPHFPTEGNTFLAKEGGLLKTDYGDRDRIYYEYTNLTFAKPQEGWLVEYDRLPSFVADTLSVSLGLTSQETFDLIRDVQASLIDKSTKKYVYVGFVSSQELQERLPFSMSPTPKNLHRIHLFLDPTDSPLSTTAPSLHTIDRDGFTVVELGVYVK